MRIIELGSLESRLSNSDEVVAAVNLEGYLLVITKKGKMFELEKERG